MLIAARTESREAGEAVVFVEADLGCSLSASLNCELLWLSSVVGLYNNSQLIRIDTLHAECDSWGCFSTFTGFPHHGTAVYIEEYGVK